MNSASELRLLLTALRELPDGPADAVLATLTRTFGSTFRRPGTRMLVRRDGSVVCELSGGCPQRDIVHRARQCLADGAAGRIHYNAESGLDVMLEMGCGGELEVLLEPLQAEPARRLADALDQCLAQRRSATLATLFAVDEKDVTPRRLLWNDAGVRLDELHDDALAARLQQAGRGAQGHVETLSLSSPVGQTDVLLEPIAPPQALLLIGTSAAALALAQIALALGWETVLIDDDPQRLREAALSGLTTLCAEPGQLSAKRVLDRQTALVAMTHNLERDTAWMTAMQLQPLGYLGALGSRERAARMRGRVRDHETAMRVPAGLDIGSEAPPEIALAVAAEIMAVFNGRSGGSLGDRQGAIHDD